MISKNLKKFSRTPSPAQERAQKRNWYLLQLRGIVAQLNTISFTTVIEQDRIFRDTVSKMRGEILTHILMAKSIWAAEKAGTSYTLEENRNDTFPISN